MSSSSTFGKGGNAPPPTSADNPLPTNDSASNNNINNNDNNNNDNNINISSSSNNNNDTNDPPPPTTIITTDSPGQHVVTITTKDLDVEDAEGELLETIERRNAAEGGSTSSSLVGNMAEIPSGDGDYGGGGGDSIAFVGDGSDTNSNNQTRLFRVLSSQSSTRGIVGVGGGGGGGGSANSSLSNRSSNRSVTNRLTSSDPTASHGNNNNNNNNNNARRPSFRDVAERVKRMNMLKMAAMKSQRKLSSSHVTPHSLLQDIQEEEESEAILNQHHHHHQHHDGEKDGLMKDNWYAANYDHVLLKAESTSDSDNDDDDERTLLAGNNSHNHRHPNMPGAPARGHHRSQSAPIDFHNIQQPAHQQQQQQQQEQTGHGSISLPTPFFHRQTSTTSAPTHMMRGTSAATSDYVASDPDGFMDVVVNANPSFISQTTGTTTNQGNFQQQQQQQQQQHQQPSQPKSANFHWRSDMASTGTNISANTSTAETTSASCYPAHSSRSCHNIKAKHIFPRWMREICAMCHPYRMGRNIQEILVRSLFLWVGFPCLLTSFALYYFLDNPELEFLPGEPTLAWWFLFATRQTVTLGLARLTVYVVVDGFMLGTRLAVQTLGPLLTLTAATGKGWPLILSTWGVWNLVLVQGDTPFQRNWLYWTRIEFFNLNYEGTMLNSSLYTRILVSAILCGLAVSAKRTIMALRFGRKQFAEFKPRLERILADVVLISEIGTLAETADQVEEVVEAEEEENVGSWDLITKPKSKKDLKDFLWAPNLETDHSIEEEMEDSTTSNEVSSITNADRGTSLAENIMDEYGPAFVDSPAGNRPTLSRTPRMTLNKTDSGRLKIKDMLDPWAEPDLKGDKSADISIHDILKFRRALSHLDEENLFGEAFGSTANRDQCIASSHSVYFRLLKLAAETNDGNKQVIPGVLPFDVLALLTLQDDGETENISKKRMLRKIFTPDRSGGLPLLAFVQATDKIYKRLRFFRASIRNASVIDSVLESLFNGLFYFVLAMLLSSLMQLNPWTFLVSITSLLVSVSFALGSSVSKYVEGILLIAIRRPYDLGDRIFMSSAEGINPTPDVTANSWFVEDITLTTTTLRYAQTNEVSTVNNWSIAGSRIVNCARSSNATVHVKFSAHLSILEGKKLQMFQNAIHKHVEAHPRVWDSVGHIRHDMFDADKEKIEFAIALRHRSSWQESGRIKLDRADVFRLLHDLGNQLNIHYTEPASQQILYQGGNMKRGDNEDCYMRDLMKGSNLRTA